MKKIRLVLLVIVSFCLSAAAFAQKTKPATPAAKPGTAKVIFAVLQNGETLEPIATVNGGKLKEPANGSDAANIIAAFDRAYYKPGTVYKLIFGSTASGTVTIKSSNPKGDCGKNIATVTTKANKTPLKGLVMGLATNAGIKNEKNYRRKPSPTEKAEIDALARAEFERQKLTPTTLHYQNLTAVDVDHDGVPEFVGSYWVEIDKLTRGLLFFIASKGAGGKYSIGYKEYRSVDQSSVMSQQISNVDEGVYHELLLDTMDVDGDGRDEIFTYEQAFEGNGFRAYRKSGSKWVKMYEFSNYHCAY